MAARLVVAVDTVRSKDGQRVTAGAVLYPVNATEPVFEYEDACGRQRRTRFLSNPSRIPEYAVPSVVCHVRHAALSWALITRPANQASEATGLAVSRCVERLLHQHPEHAEGLAPGEIHIYLPTSRKISTDYVSTAPQIPRANSWRTGAARLLASQRE